jgi:signal transduction histidine kinase
VSHDLKTPLTSMTMSLALIREEVADESGESPALPLLDRAVAGSMRMAALIDDVLAFAVLGDLRAEDVDLGEVVRHVLVDLGERLDGVDLVVGDLPVVWGNPVQLRALVQNLLDNAVKFTHPDRPPVVRVTAHAVPGAWRIEVTDNGRGIPSGLHESVFEPLRRLEELTPGVGLGLATSRRVVQAHDGTIGLTGSPTGGTTAWFELPTTRPEA